MPGLAGRVLDVLPKDAETALRMLEGISFTAASRMQEADEGPAVPWREALGNVLAKHGGEVATMVRACREAKDMTQQALADAVGLHKSNISEIERGKRPVGKALARKLAAALDADYRMFL
jgi:ribosome-binding protein aMBF1 (putative translation factor)